MEARHSGRTGPVSYTHLDVYKRQVDVEICDPARDEMLDLAERLAELNDEQWNSPSLCALWRIRDVLAHVTAGAEGAFGVGAIVGGMLRHGFNYNRWVAADGQARGQQDLSLIHI